MDFAYCEASCAGDLADPAAVAHKYNAPFEPLLAKCKSANLDGVAPNGLLRLAILNEAVAVIPIAGILTPDYQVDIRSQLIQAMNSPGVEEILLLVNSPGGFALGTEETAQVLRSVEGKMSVTAIVQGVCASGGYYIASQARKIIATPSSWIGSVGTIAVMTDYSKLYDEAGIRVVSVATSPVKSLGLTGKPITPEDVAVVERRINAIHLQFVFTLRNTPRLSDDQLLEANKADIYLAEEAQRRGLIDDVELLEVAVRDLELKYDHLVNNHFGAAAVAEAMQILGVQYMNHLDGEKLEELRKQRPHLAGEVRRHLKEQEEIRAGYRKVFNSINPGG